MSLPAAYLTTVTAHGGTVSSGYPRVLIGGKPASRCGDMHVCPMLNVLVPHVGGNVGAGSVNVWTGNLPQSRLTDLCFCPGPPNMVLFGHPFTLVGQEGADGPDAAAMMAAYLAAVSAAASGEKPPYPRAVLDKDGNPITEYSKGVTVKGDSEYQAKVTSYLDTIASTPEGKSKLDRIADSGKNVTIVPSPDGKNRTVDSSDINSYSYPTGKPGKGTDSTIQFNPDGTTTHDGSQDWMNRPPDVGLFHELGHAANDAEGVTDQNATDINGQTTSGADAQVIGLGKYANDPNTENAYRKSRGLPPRTHE
jgi:uncharacterized Zn-binding protein involved in type VI secretion